ncbi:hypothetical protein [Paraliobacillus ryukyuensis]|uniref:hypothetical protein n=1 Tax=Paraliobacillus ryukyuensis TaxID=200904 RepID=UPI000DEA36CF|nr:hypothetical protein [Paraliobacillus ryukyuensis]
MLVSFLGYMGAYSDPVSYQLPNWYLHIWWSGIFLIGVGVTLVGSRDYFDRKDGSKKVIWLDLLFIFSYFSYGLLPFEQSINTLITLLFGAFILMIENIKFFIPLWRKPRSF